MIYVVGVALFIVCFLMLVSYVDWREHMDFWDEFKNRRDEDE